MHTSTDFRDRVIDSFSCIFDKGEALGALGPPDLIDLLRKYAQDPVVEVREPEYSYLQGHLLHFHSYET